MALVDLDCGLRTEIENIMHNLEYISSTRGGGADQLFFIVGYQRVEDLCKISLIIDNHFKILINQTFKSILSATIAYIVLYSTLSVLISSLFT